MHAIGLLHGIRETFRGSCRAVAAAVALALLPLPTLVAAARLDAVTGESRGAASATQPGNPKKSVLILSGASYGAPVSDAITAGATATLKAQGISGADIYVEHLDLARNKDPRWRAELAGVLRGKLTGVPVGLVIAQNQAALEFLAREGHELVPTGTPVLGTIITSANVAWQGAALPVLNVTNRWDIRGTLRIGLDLFPRTRRVFVVAGADELLSEFHAQAAQVLSVMQPGVEVEFEAAASYEGML